MSDETVFHEASAPLPVEAEELWEINAGWWQDSFTEGADPEYTEQIIPLLLDHLTDVAPAHVLDIGCGEGQLSRLATGVPGVRQVVGVDPTKAQLTAALARQPAAGRPGAPGYARGSASALPFPDGSFDAAFACLVFEHIEGTAGALAEVGRVLRPGGTFLLLLNHPLAG
jgi:ubiquinone/menaquinone biosynthesis C-methylase UbiE